jgi:hypothetical protein
VVTNKLIYVLLINQISEEDIVVVETNHGNMNFIAVSTYLDIENEITEDLNKTENILHFAKGRGLLVEIDSNARSKTWHNVLTDKRGRLLEEFIIGNRLHIINEESQLTTFESNKGNSNVDLTMADNKMVTLVKEWQCNEQESFSDHRIITFRIEKNRGATGIYTHHGIKHVTSEEGYKNFTAEIKHNFTLREPEVVEGWTTTYTKQQHLKRTQN